MADYDFLARHYDLMIIVNGTERVKLLQALIEEYRPDAKTLLELACGTAYNLVGLAPRYEVFGLDLSEGMLEVARKKIPSATFYQADMSKFDLKERFDVILCVFDSINHLLDFAQWQSLFEHAHDHLNPHGLLIFDINTLEKLERLSRERPLFEEVKPNYMSMKITNNGNHLYNWSILLFEQEIANKFRLYEENILETSFDVPRIEEAVRKHFEIKRVFDPQRAQISQESNRVYFVCQRED
jgi:SAM-dependent methyltransferase